jgi:hypothetical protein
MPRLKVGGIYRVGGSKVKIIWQRGSDVKVEDVGSIYSGMTDIWHSSHFKGAEKIG